MTRHIRHQNYQEVYEYHGNTTIVLTRKKAGTTVRQDWILFDSVEEAAEYFNTECCAVEGPWNS